MPPPGRSPVIGVVTSATLGRRYRPSRGFGRAVFVGERHLGCGRTYVLSRGRSGDGPKANRARAWGAGQSCPLRRLRYRNGDVRRFSRPRDVQVGDRRCPGASGRVQSAQASGRLRRSLRLERAQPPELSQPGRPSPMWGSTGSLGHRGSVRESKAEVWELRRCVRRSYLLQKPMGGMWRAFAGEEPSAGGSSAPARTHAERRPEVAKPRDRGHPACHAEHPRVPGTAARVLSGEGVPSFTSQDHGGSR